MKKMIFIAAMLFSTRLVAQDYKDNQVLKFTDDTKTVVVIDEFLMLKGNGEYKPINVKLTDFYDYHKTPLGIRYYNFGCVKTKRSGFWMGQIAKDKKGHAIFKEPIYGIRTMILMNAEIIEDRQENTLLKFFNVYAPCDDCVGSLEKDKNGNCPRGYNRPDLYAQAVGDKVGLKIDEPIKLRDEKGEIDTKLMTLLISAVAKFETGKDCKIEEETVIKALSLKE